jgi:hypothetical protein
MEHFTNLSLRIPKEFDFELNIYLAKLKHAQVKKTKAELFVELAQEGYLHKNTEKP